MPGDNSKAQYLKAYVYLIKNADSYDLDDILEYILSKKSSDNTKAYYLNAIIGLKKIDAELVEGDISKFNKYRDHFNTKIENDRSVDNVRKGQKDALDNVDLQDLKDYVEELKEKKDESLKNLEDYLVLALMVHFALRNDLQEIELVHLYCIFLKKVMQSLV